MANYDTSFNLNSSYNTKKYDSVDVTYDNVGAQSGLGIFKVIVLILLCLALFRVLSSSTPFTFESLIYGLSNLPRVNFSFTQIIDTSILGDWGIFNFLRNVIEVSLSIVNVGAWLCKLLGQGIYWLYNFMTFLLF